MGFTSVIKDVMGVLRKAVMINTLLNTAILFLLLYLVFTLINLFPLMLSIIVSLFYLVYVWAKKAELYTIRMVEQKFPALRDRLTTARDTMESESFVVNKLRVEVSRKLSNVEAGELFSYGKITMKIIAVIAVTFLILFTTMADFRIMDSEKALSGLHWNIKIGGKDKNIDAVNGTAAEFESNNFDITGIEDEKTSFKKEEFVSYDELKAIGAQEYNDPITEEEKLIVRSYFDKINSR